MRLKVNKMFILLIKDDFLEAIEILEDSDIKWCALATMFGTQDVTKKLNLYIKFYDMEIDNLTPDHLKLRIDPISLFVGGVRHIIGKLSMRATTFL
jgi:hypothetical protein